MPIDPAQALRDHFFGWQCRIRQIAVREHGGRPSPGMRPRVLAEDGRELAPALTVLILPRAPQESTAFFRFQVQRSADPAEVRERGLAFLRAEHFRRPRDFDERLTAALPRDSALAAALHAGERCLLEFSQFRQFYSLPCASRELPPDDPARQATLWHNRLFNPALPDDVRVLAFQPHWGRAEARPAPGPSPLAGEGRGGGKEAG
jgi:hypothetical protein